MGTKVNNNSPPTILAAGCISTDPVQTKTAAQGNQIDAKETPPKVDAPVEEAEPAPVETHWWDSKDGFEDAQVGIIHTTLFGDIDAVKHMGNSNYPQNYELFNIETEALIGTHQEFTPDMLNLERELQPAQYKALIAEYGRPSLIIMETIDTDGGGMDKVAVRYEGGKGSFDFITKFRGTARVSGVIYEYLDTKI